MLCSQLLPCFEFAPLFMMAHLGLRHLPHWCPEAFYLAVSSFQNNGLAGPPIRFGGQVGGPESHDPVLGHGWAPQVWCVEVSCYRLSQQVFLDMHCLWYEVDFVSSPLLLSTIGTLILLGNTGLPIMVRFIAASWRRRAVPFSETKKVLDFLLEHPRRCFTHMFPAVHTMWLMIVVIALNVVGTVVILVQDWDSHAFNGLQSHQKIVNALFQTVSTRTAGVNSINIAQLSQGTTFFMAVMMYFSTTPTVVTMRLSAAQHELDITGRVEGVEEDVLKGENSLKGQARRYLTQDATYLVVICFLICCLEQDNFSRAAKYPSPDSDGIYTDFGFFKVLFELLSAYGTCGLSLGFENQTFSFSGVWSEASQMLLVFTMLLGRLRGLPDSIDASVRVAMVAEEAKEEDCDFVRF
ncbi:unnamed protein product [Effrenium voratum]|nr:unnamed protein product [Effrenium voratum]